MSQVWLASAVTAMAPIDFEIPGMCRRMTSIDFETLGDVLHFFPRMYKDYQFCMVDGENATLVGTVVSNNCSIAINMTTMKLGVDVDVDHLAKLGRATQSSGKQSYLIGYSFSWSPF